MNEKLLLLAETLASLEKCVRELAAESGTEGKSPAPVVEPDTKTVIKLEDVRAVLADISRKGHTREMKALLTEFGAEKLSEVDPANYPDLLRKAKEVLDA